MLYEVITENQKGNAGEMVKKRRRLNYILRLLLVFLGMHVVWYVAYLLVHHPMLPSPLEVYQAMGHLGGKDIVLNVGYSLMRIFAGVLRNNFV